MTKMNAFLTSAVLATFAAASANAQWRKVTVETPTTPTRTVRQTANPSATNTSRMTIDDLDSQIERVSQLTPISIGKPMPFEEMRGYYQGFYGFQGMSIPGSVYPQYSSLQPARELPAYVQQELFEEFQRSGEFNPLIPGTGHMIQHLGVLEAEAKIGRGVLRDRDGKLVNVQVGPDTWTTTSYVVVSSVGILEETVQGLQIHGDDVARIVNSIPGIGGRAKQIIWDTVGRSQKSSVDRQVVGIAYVAIVDLETRSVLKSTTGVAAMSWTEFTSADIPAIRMQGVRYVGAGKFARELVQSALYDEVDRDAAVKKFVARRCKDIGNDPSCRAAEANGGPQVRNRQPMNRPAPFTTMNGDQLPREAAQPTLRRR